jgi:eukaryotic-like serine/threonine-protein kinase
MNSVSAKSCPSCGERYDADVLFCPRDGTPLASSRTPSLQNADRDPYLGIELAGQIRVKHLIGIGSMGRVYRAFQGGIERDVAVKILHRELSGNAELVSRFHREAKVASRLVHPNVVQVLMTGALPPSTEPGVGGELYLVMEHLDGISLLSALAAAGTEEVGAALPLPRALHIALQICDAVGEAHAQGIVHRDLKPENVMLVRRGDDPDYVKVLDFGIARLDWADRSMATQAGLIFGTAKYISPEGAEGLPVTPAADVYSIATMLYQMLAGRTPFEGDSPVALLVQHTHAPPTDLRSIARASYVPAQIAAVIMQNLVKKPGDRAVNAKLLGRDLVAAARAGGLYPEEMAAQSGLFSQANAGAVKLASRERTKSHELSADLASRIGGVAATATPPPTVRSEAAPQADPVPSTAPDGGAPRAPAARPSSDGAPQAPAPGGTETTVPGGPPPEAQLRGDFPPGSAPAGSAPPAKTIAMAPEAWSSGAPPAELDFDGDRIAPSAQNGSTIQGTETTLEEDYAPAPRTRRARLARLVALVACLFVVAPIAVVGGKHLGFGSSAATETLDGTLDEARDCMHRHAWDAPAGHNFKEITAQGMTRWPESDKLVELRHDAADRLVADALGHKYAGDLPEAIHLVRLALEMNPDLTTAQHLAAELEVPRGPDVAPAVTGTAGPGDGGKKGDKGPKKGGPREPRSADVRGPPPPPPGSGAGAVLPQVPPPPPPPPPSSTGPWL